MRSENCAQMPRNGSAGSEAAGGAAGLMAVRRVNCCVCGPGQVRPWGTAIDRLHGVPGRIEYVTCVSCGLLFQNPQPTVESIPSCYPSDYAPWSKGGVPPPPPRWKRAMRDSLLITGLPRAVRERLDSGGRLLDVGCGGGDFLGRIVGEHPGAHVAGLDFSVEAAAVAARRARVEVHTGTLLENEGRLEPFDVVTMWWYLEHEPEPEAVLACVFRLLRPGGWLLCGVPNSRSVAAQVFRTRWFHLDPPRHLWIFSPRHLRELAGRCGFADLHFRHDTSPWGLLGSWDYVRRGRIDGIERSSLNSRVMKALFRPASMAFGLARQGDTIALHARKP